MAQSKKPRDPKSRGYANSRGPRSKLVRKLNEQEEAFCRGLVYELLTVPEALRYAKYNDEWCSATFGHTKLLNRPHIQARIEEMRRHKEYDSICDRHFVLDELKKIVTTNSGTPQAVKALELLGKHINLFTENINVNTGDQASVADEVWKKRQAINDQSTDGINEDGGSSILPFDDVKEA